MNERNVLNHERNVLNHVDFNYYSISSFKSGVGNKQLTSVPDSFSVLHSNVRSLFNYQPYCQT